MRNYLRANSLVILLSLLFLNSSNYTSAHLKGNFLSKEAAIKQSIKLGCEGAHKKKDKWLPCRGENELHEYLRK